MVVKKCVISYTQFDPSEKCCKAILPLNNFFKILCTWIFSINRRKFENTFVLMILKFCIWQNIDGFSSRKSKEIRQILVTGHRNHVKRKKKIK